MFHLRKRLLLAAVRRQTVDQRHLARPINLNTGFSLIEVLVATVILVISLLAITHVWAFAFNVTYASEMRGLSYTVGRRVMEKAKQDGWDYSVDGTRTLYYNRNGSGESITQTSDSVISVATTVTTAINGVPTAFVSPTASTATVRTITLTVTSLADNSTTYQTSTLLVNGGI